METIETTQRYDEILELTLEQREAVERGDLRRLLELLARREMLLASLAAVPPGVEHPMWRRRIAELDSANERALLAWRERVAAELTLLQRGRTGLRGYQACVPVEDAFIDRIS